MKVSANWLATTGAEFSAGIGRQGCAHLTNYTVNYCEWGDGPPLVLVPGLAGGYGLMGPLARVLSQHYRVISYNLRGEDDCFALRRNFDLADLVNDLKEFLDYHFLENPILFGVSFGGILALEFAARYGHRVDKLILNGVGARFQRSLLQRVAGLVLSRFPLPTDSPFINQFFNLLFGGKQRNKALFQFVTRQCWQTDQGVMAHRFRLVEAYDMEDRLSRVHVPTLVLSGDKDLLVSVESLAALRHGIPDCEFVKLHQAGHLGFATQPELVAEETHRFLQSKKVCVWDS